MAEIARKHSAHGVLFVKVQHRTIRALRSRTHSLARATTSVCHSPQVYVSEAHPTDEWAVYSDIDYCQPTTLDERKQAAQRYLSPPRSAHAAAGDPSMHRHPPMQAS